MSLNNKRHKLIILLSTYNGSHFLDAQLASLEQQTFKAFHLLIRDDGSTDGNPPIFRDFKSRG